MNPGYCCSNMLALVPDGEQPCSRIVGPKLSYMDERIATIDLVISKLVRRAFSYQPGLLVSDAICRRKSNFRR